MGLRPASFSSVASPADWGGRVTRAEIDLGAIAANVGAIAARVAPAEVMAVVKADAYGHGATAVARTALAAGATRLAVYTVDEAVVLRDSGVTAPILVFGSVSPGEAPVIWRHRLTPTVTNRETAHALARHAQGDPLPVHVKVDTGLTRAGVLSRDTFPLLRSLAGISSLVAEGLYTHLACADDPGSSANDAQLAVFRQLIRELGEEGVHPRILHAANSGAALNLPEARFDLVRTGIAMYGYYPSKLSRRDVPLRPALSLVSVITRLTTIPEGTGVGYGHTYRAPGTRTIALVPAGYADGVSRALGCGVGKVLVRGIAVPIVGRVSMDQITLDVSDVPEARAGDEVVLIGQQGGAVLSADDHASATQTISYEVLAGIAARVPRLYARDGRITSVRAPFHAADEPLLE